MRDRNLTERLTGLRTREIRSIRAKLAELGRFAKTSSDVSLRDWAGEKLKYRTSDAVDLIEEIRSLEDESRVEEYDRLEQGLLDIGGKIRQTKSDTLKSKAPCLCRQPNAPQLLPPSPTEIHRVVSSPVRNEE